LNIQFLSYFCAIRVLFVIPWWTFSIKRDEEPKDTSKYIFMSIY